MGRVRIVTSLLKLSDSELPIKAQTIINKVSGNAAFPDPTPPIAQVQAIKDAYEAALSAVRAGGKEKVMVKNQTRTELLETLSKLGLYVELNCQDNEVVALSSGFDLAKKATPIGDLPKPDRITVNDGANVGEVEVSVDSIKGAKSYFFQYTSDPVKAESVWASVPCSKSRVTIKNLGSVKRYWFRAAAVGTNTTLNFSDSISRVVQ